MLGERAKFGYRVASAGLILREKCAQQSPIGFPHSGATRSILHPSLRCPPPEQPKKPIHRMEPRVAWESLLRPLYYFGSPSVIVVFTRPVPFGFV